MEFQRYWVTDVLIIVATSVNYLHRQASHLVPILITKTQILNKTQILTWVRD